MKVSPSLLATSLLATAIPAFAQTDTVYSIERPADFFAGWSTSMGVIQDVDGDGVEDLFIGTDRHGGGPVASVHSGKTGAYLYTLSVPAIALFAGQGIVSVSDQSGDGIPELLVFAGRSGDSHSIDGNVTIHSGADGTILDQFQPPAGVFIRARHFDGVHVISDVDGDGSEDVLCRTQPALTFGSLAWTAFSSATGQVLFTATHAGDDNYLFAHSATLMSDHDGDGLVDFATATNPNGTLVFEVRSGATGQVIAHHEMLGAPVPTSNGEPFTSVPDVDGDGLRDLAVGAVFEGFVGLYSSADGSLLHTWECATQDVPCMGSRIIAMPSPDRSGGVSLLTIQALIGTPTEIKLVGLNPITGGVEFDQAVPELVGGYSGSDRIVTMNGVDENGFATFAVANEGIARVNVRRVAMDLGQPTCGNKVAGHARNAGLRAIGSPNRSGNGARLEMTGLPAGSAVLFLAGQPLQTPLANAKLCIGNNPMRLAFGQSDSSGMFAHELDLFTLDQTASAWTFQALYRNSSTGLFTTSNATMVKVQD